MDMNSEHVVPLYDRQGRLYAVMLSADIWAKVGDRLSPILDEALGVKPVPAPAEVPEPLEDWEQLKSFWDFKYPVDMDVTCGECGNSTEDWLHDDPRKFRLKVANLGGLVSFQCLRCNARVTKKHFKDHIKTETTPYQEKKSKP